MRFTHTKFIYNLLLLTSLLLAACGSGSTSGTVAPVIPPAAPVVATPVAGCNAIDISWAAVSGATGYNVYYSTSSGGTFAKLTTTAPITATSYTNAGLTVASPLRYYKVTAVNAGGESSYSNQVSATTKQFCTNIGGSVQGNSLALTTAVSTLAGTVMSAGLVDGTGSAARFTSPQGITTDGTNLYVADTVNHAIRQIVISTGVVSTVAGSGTSGFANGTGTAATFSNPKGITITPDKKTLYVADTGNNTIRKIDLFIVPGAVTTVAGTVGTATFVDGIGTAATFNIPAGITTDGTNLYVADTGNNAIRQIAISGAVVTTVAGTVAPGFAGGAGPAARFTSPQGITTDGTNLYVADTGNNAIRQIVISGATVTIVAGTGTAGSTDSGATSLFKSPQGITMDGPNLYVADTANDTIRKIVIAGTTVSTLAGAALSAGATDGTGPAALFRLPAGITTDGTNLYTVDTGNQTIRKIQ